MNTGNSSIPQASGQANAAPAGSTSVPDTYVPGVTVNPIVEAPPVMNPNPSIPNQPMGEAAFGSTPSPNPVNSMPWNNSAPSGFDRPRRY